MQWLFLSIALFIPPEKWEIADPATLGKSVEIGFVTKGRKELCPSINLASEKTDLSLEEYLQIVRSLHAKKGTLRDLGPYETLACKGHLLELDTPSKFGTVRLMQFVFLQGGKAYALTAAAAKEEFSAHLQTFRKAFASFRLIDNLGTVLGQEKLQELIASWKKSEGDIKSRKALENYVLKDCARYGAHFQVLLLKLLAEKESP